MNDSNLVKMTIEMLEAIRTDTLMAVIIPTIYFVGLAGFVNTQVNRVIEKLNDLEKKK